MPWIPEEIPVGGSDGPLLGSYRLHLEMYPLPPEFYKSIPGPLSQPEASSLQPSCMSGPEAALAAAPAQLLSGAGFGFSAWDNVP